MGGSWYLVFANKEGNRIGCITASDRAFLFDSQLVNREDLIKFLKSGQIRHEDGTTMIWTKVVMFSLTNLKN